MTTAFTPRRIGLVPPQRRVAAGAVAPSQSARLGHYVPSNPRSTHCLIFRPQTELEFFSDLRQGWYNTNVNIDATNVPVRAQIAKASKRVP